jgi:hypothetical protein
MKATVKQAINAQLLNTVRGLLGIGNPLENFFQFT